MCIALAVNGNSTPSVAPIGSTAIPLSDVIAMTASAAQAQTLAAVPPTSANPIEQLKTAIINKLGDSNRKVQRLEEFSWSDSDKTLIIKWAINDNLTQDYILGGSQRDVTDMLQIIAQGGYLPDYQFVTFVGTFPLRDNFGNISEERVVTASYNKSTVDKINWSNFLSDDVFKIADTISIHPAMTAP
jgi:hypothetical protein